MKLNPISSIFLPALAALVLFCRPVHATIYWQADTNRGLAVFPTLDLAPGTVSVAPDPLGQFGSVYKYFLPDTNSSFGKERCESSGTEATSGEFLPAYNTDYYIGWRAMWNPMPINGSWVALFQMHGYGVSGQGAPLVLRCENGDGNLYMQSNPNGVNVDFWHTKFYTNVWQTFVIHVFLSTNPAVGYTEIWYNGVLQTNINGTTRWYGPTWDNVDGVWSDSYNKFKWGCYRSGSLDGHGLATAYMSSAKVTSTYAEADPNGGGDFSLTNAPPSQTVSPGGNANYSVTVAPIGGFTTNVNLTVTGLPTGTTAGFSQNTITNAGNSTLIIMTTGSTPVGSYTVSVIGTSGILAHTNTIALVVSGFGLSASPVTATINTGSSTNFAVAVATNSAFTGNVALGISGLPSGTTAAFNPASLLQSGSSTLTVNTTSNTPSGNFPLTITATNGGLVLSTNIMLIVNGVTGNPGLMYWTHGGADTNWSTILNWTNPAAGGNGPPGVNNILMYTNLGTVNASALTSPGSGVLVPANVNGFVNANFSVLGITNFANAASTSPNYQNVQIANGVTFTSGGVQVGGFIEYDFGGNNTVNMSISGAGATLLDTNGPVIVSQGSGTTGTHDATLDLSALDTFQMIGAQIKLGSEKITRACGILYLAKTNTLTLLTSGYSNSDGSGSPYSGNPALYLGHNTTQGGIGSQLYLGISNCIAVDYVSIGRGDVDDVMKFNPAFTNQNPSAFISGTNGSSSPVSVYVVGDDSPGAGGSASATNDFTGGMVNLFANYLCVARGREGASDTGTSAASLSFNNGNVTANTLVIGFLYPNGSNSFANGTVNVNGGTLVVNSNLTLASRPTTGGSGATSGTLNINGGLVQATNIIGGGGTSIINLSSGTLELLPGWSAVQGIITNISTLNVGGGSGNPAQLNDAALIATTNTVTVASNGVIAGNTVITAPALVVSGVLSPGSSGNAGAITNTGATTLGAGGSLQVEVDDALAGPAVGWSYLQSGGGINIQSTPANPFTISVQTSGGPAANFNAAGNYDWVIATGSGIANFATNKFAISTGLFQNSTGGGNFYLHTSGNSLVLSFTNNLPPSTPVVTGIGVSGNQLVFSGTNGVVFGMYYVLAGTNLSSPPSQWPCIATNYFDGAGNFSFTNGFQPGLPQQFFMLRLP